MSKRLFCNYIAGDKAESEWLWHFFFLLGAGVWEDDSNVTGLLPDSKPSTDHVLPPDWERVGHLPA